jgi:hypothetical protein
MRRSGVADSFTRMIDNQTSARRFRQQSQPGDHEISMRLRSLPFMSVYAPRAIQDPAFEHATFRRLTLGFVAALAGSGASDAVQVPPDRVSMRP